MAAGPDGEFVSARQLFDQLGLERKGDQGIRGEHWTLRPQRVRPRPNAQELVLCDYLECTMLARKMRAYSSVWRRRDGNNAGFMPACFEAAAWLRRP